MENKMSENAIKNSSSPGQQDVSPCTELESLIGENFQIGEMDLEHSMDPKKLKRIMSNRASAQRSRLKQLQYIHIMESRLKSLQAEKSLMLSEIAIQRERQNLLNSENLFLKQQLIISGTDSQFLSARTEEYQAELHMLRQLCVTTPQQLCVTTPPDQSISEEEDWSALEEELRNC